MKRSLFILGLFFTTLIHAQYYDYTGKIKGLALTVSPAVSLQTKQTNPRLSYYSSSIEYSRMLTPGVFPTLGYTYQRAYQTKKENRFDPITPFNDAHQLNASIEIRKCILSKSYKVTSVIGCFFKRFGILLAPEYNYLYSQQVKNNSPGEFALKTGVYFYQGSTKINVSKTILFSAYYRKGFTPLFTEANNNTSFYRDEIGIRISVLFRELYRFGW